MGTRCGDIDPAVVLHIQNQLGLSASVSLGGADLQGRAGQGSGRWGRAISSQINQHPAAAQGARIEGTGRAEAKGLESRRVLLVPETRTARLTHPSL